MGWTRDELAKRSDDQIAAIASRVTNRLAKWRSVFAGWQLGTRFDTDPECKAVRDHRETTILLRAEVNALTACLVEAGVFTARRFTEQVILECEHLDTSYEARFPGMRSTDDGIAYELPLAAETMRGWQSEWFISRVKEHARAGIPLACCDEWPECSHMLAWYEAHREEILGRKGDT